MLIQDRIYGKFEIKEKVLIDLINSKALQRLKGISQLGMPQEYYHKQTYSRYEHSVGVFLLLRVLKASLKEQIAGLIHDVSHTAFSHVVDWVVGSYETESYQDEIFLEILNNTDIPEILKEHNIEIDEVKDLEKFTLLEREIPSLCADRIDYSLREMAVLNSRDFIEEILKNFVVKGNQICIKDKEVAEKFAKNFLELQKEHWAGAEAKVRYYILSEILREAINKEYIKLEDLSMTDNEVLEILYKTKDKNIISLLNKLKRPLKIKHSEKNGIEIKKKFRYIDPEVLVDNNIKKLSEISESYNSILKKEKIRSKINVFVEIM